MSERRIGEALPGGFLAVLATVAATCPAHADTWRRYTNERFGTSIVYPADRFAMQPPPANNDGRTFMSKDRRSVIRVYGSYGPTTVTENFSAYRTWITNQEQKDGLKLTYTAGGQDWFILSGFSGSDIVYEKVVASCPDRSLAQHVRIQYPAAERAAFDAIVARVSRSLRQGRRVGC